MVTWFLGTDTDSDLSNSDTEKDRNQDFLAVISENAGVKDFLRVIPENTWIECFLTTVPLNQVLNLISRVSLFQFNVPHTASNNNSIVSFVPRSHGKERWANCLTM